MYFKPIRLEAGEEEKNYKMEDRVTIWRRQSREGNWEHNHIENGWNYNAEPTPLDDNQAQIWKGAKWSRSWGHIENGKVVELVKQKEA
jgi:hypothetical protein